MKPGYMCVYILYIYIYILEKHLNMEFDNHFCHFAIGPG